MLASRVLRCLLCALSCAWWLPTGTASRLKTPALPIQSEREPVPSKGLAGECISVVADTNHIYCLPLNLTL